MTQTIQKCPYADKNEQPRVTPVTIRAAIFFDGTLNNRVNTTLRTKGLASKVQLTSDSYLNDYSNVAKLETVMGSAFPGYDVSIKTYVEGIGTENLSDDSSVGAALGMGSSGVGPKVKKGLDYVFNRILSEVDRTVPIAHIHLDSFGFSRGAAAARHFIHKALVDKNSRLATRLEKQGYSVGSVRMRFVGLFDTVASYGLVHTNDTRDLDLDAVSHAESVIQLVAAEEHRANFRLTNINSANSGRQIFLPGVHSDIGGGYVNGASENRLLFQYTPPPMDSSYVYERLVEAARTSAERDRKWFLDQGWYTKDELMLENNDPKLWGKRASIKNSYSLIPLHLMAQFATKLTLPWSSNLYAMHAIPHDLSSIYAMIQSYAMSDNASCSEDWLNKRTPQLKALRHEYLHVSAYYGSPLGAHDPQWSNDGPLSGKRKRIIQDG